MLWSTFVGQPFFGVCMIQDRRFLYANDRLAELLDYEANELLALPSVLDVVDGDTDALCEAVRPLLERQSDRIRLALRARRRDGTLVDLEVQAISVIHDTRPAILGVQCDVTARAIEERLHETQALHALAARVAHDFNNVLAAIGATAQLMAVEDQPQQLCSDLDEINRAVRRGAGLCRRLANLGSD